MNLLITSVGRRVKIVEYFKENLINKNGKVVVADCDRNAPALYFADEYEIVPMIKEKNYINTLLQICEKYSIEAIISLIDPELSLLAENAEVFKENDVKLILSSKNMTDLSFNKQSMHDFLVKKNINTVPTFSDIESFKESDYYRYPLILKPKTGSASSGVKIINNEEDLMHNLDRNKNFVLQPYFKEREYGIDVYVDMLTGELVDLFIKEKINMRAGETDKSISVHNEQIETLVKKLVSKTNFKGPIDIDCFEFNGEYYISEINPRFGGGYPHAYESGVNFMKYIINNLEGNLNERYQSYSYIKNSVMMKFDHVVIR